MPLPAVRSRRGVAAAELAILLPFIALMLVAAVDYCRIYYDAQVVDSAASSGCLYASGAVRRDRSISAEQAARDAAVADGVSLDPPLAPEDVDVTITDTSATVTVTHRCQSFTNYPGLPTNVTVRRSVTMPRAPRAPGEE